VTVVATLTAVITNFTFLVSLSAGCEAGPPVTAAGAGVDCFSGTGSRAPASGCGILATPSANLSTDTGDVGAAGFTLSFMR